MIAGRVRVLSGACAALAGLSLLASCAGIPDSSAPRIVEQVPKAGPTEEADVRFQPRPPRRGQSPVEVVQGFLDAATSRERQHDIARQFLTPGAAAKWRDDEGAIILRKAALYLNRESETTVTLSANRIGVLDSTGAYTPYPPGGPSYSLTLQLAKVGHEWRINNPPAGVIMTEDNFGDVYRRLNVYFLTSNAARVVPDPRWFSASHDALPNLLLKALLAGPSTGLADAVKTELGDGVALASNVVPEGDRVRVHLTGLAGRSRTAQAGASAQIVWTLSQLGLPTVEVYDDSELLAEHGTGPAQRLDDWRSYDPDAMPLVTPCYFVRQGAVWTTDDKAISGPAGRFSYRAQSVGVSPGLSRLAVVRHVSGGVALYVGEAHGALTRRLTAASLTEPTWDTAGDGAVWTVRNGTDILLLPMHDLPVQVEAPDLDRTQPIWKLRLSRDGSRVALLAGPRGAEELYVGAVSAARPAVTELRSIVPGLKNVIDVAWASADSLVVLSTNGADNATAYSVGVDGSWSKMETSSGLPGPPTAVAAAPGHATVAVADGGIWRLHDQREGWTGVYPRQSGPSVSSPAYPG